MTAFQTAVSLMYLDQIMVYRLHIVNTVQLKKVWDDLLLEGALDLKQVHLNCRSLQLQPCKFCMRAAIVASGH
jgi:hypothetical protein